MANLETMTINMGPQHPSTHGVLQLILELDGEIIRKATPHIGFLHRGVEKLAEHRTYHQILPLTDRLDYLAPMHNNLGYVLAVEKLLDITDEIPERAQVIRVLLAELTRIKSHLVWLACHALDIGAMTVFIYAFREREHIMDIYEKVSGARMTTNYFRVGGLSADLPAGLEQEIREFVNTMPGHIDTYEGLLTGNKIWQKRIQGVGVISAADAINYGFTGPNLRAAGVDYDVRKDRPYYDYETYDFDVPVGEHGDCYDRYLCRMEEMQQSVSILRQAMARLPDGPINVDDPNISLPSKTDAMSDMESMIHHFKLITEGIPAPEGDCYMAIEGSKGELGMYVVAEEGDTKPVRWRVRPPSFVNLSVIAKLAEGHLLSDLIMINASLDIVLGEIDR